MTAERNTLGDRLRWAIARPSWREGRRRGLRLFQLRITTRAAEVRKAGGRRFEGIALSSIQKYLNGNIDPPLSFLQEAALVLGLREAWLISGDGFPTEEENTAAADLGQKPGLQAIGRMVLRSRVAEELEEGGFGFWDLPDSTRESVLQGLDSYLRLAASTTKDAERHGTQTPTERFARYLAAPFTILGIDRGALEPVERALLVDSLLRPLDIVRWAVRREAASEVGAAERARRTRLDKAPVFRWLMESIEPGYKPPRKRRKERSRPKN